MSSMRNDFKIALLSSSYPRFLGDHLGCFVQNLVASMAARPNIQFHIVAPSDAKINEVLSSDNVHVSRFKYFFPTKWQRLACGNGIPENLESSFLAWWQIPFFFISYLIHAWKVARHCDVIWAHWILPSGLVAALLKPFLKIPIVLTAHSGDIHYLKKMPFTKWITVWLLKNMDHITVVSEHSIRVLKESVPSFYHEELDRKLTILPMGINTDDYAKSIDNTRETDLRDKLINISYIGRLAKIKGVDTLIRAISLLPTSFKEEINLVVAGAGLERDALQCLASQLKVKVNFVGSLNHEAKVSFLKKSDVVVIPSRVMGDGRTEGLPVVLLEAMAAGKLVIASNVGGIDEVIEGGQNGLLIEPEDIKGLSDYIVELITNSEKIALLGRNARQSSKKFELNDIGDSFAAILKACTKKDSDRFEAACASLVGWDQETRPRPCNTA